MQSKNFFYNLLIFYFWKIVVVLSIFIYKIIKKKIIFSCKFKVQNRFWLRKSLNSRELLLCSIRDGTILSSMSYLMVISSLSYSPIKTQSSSENFSPRFSRSSRSSRSSNSSTTPRNRSSVWSHTRSRIRRSNSWMRTRWTWEWCSVTSRRTYSLTSSTRNRVNKRYLTQSLNWCRGSQILRRTTNLWRRRSLKVSVNSEEN